MVNGIKGRLLYSKESVCAIDVSTRFSNLKAGHLTGNSQFLCLETWGQTWDQIPHFPGIFRFITKANL